jgi:RimJ/RimL family protein N-acetyltransferase
MTDQQPVSSIQAPKVNLVEAMNFPIHTDRLIIRFFKDTDFSDHHQLMCDPEVVRYLYEEPLIDVSKARIHFESRLNSRSLEENCWLNVVVECDGRFVGELGLSLKPQRMCEVGYVFLKKEGGRGFATEAVRMLLLKAFSVLNAHRVFGRLDARNVRSAQLLERLGMRREGIFRETEFIKGEWTDEAQYAILEDEWRSRLEQSL